MESSEEATEREEAERERAEAEPKTDNGSKSTIVRVAIILAILAVAYLVYRRYRSGN